MNDKSINRLKRPGKSSGRKVVSAITHCGWDPPQKYAKGNYWRLGRIAVRELDNCLSFFAFTLCLPTADLYKQDNGKSLVCPRCC